MDGWEQATLGSAVGEGGRQMVTLSAGSGVSPIAWYDAGMTKTPDKPGNAKAGFTLGRRGFARISAVEGIRLSSDMEERFREFDRQDLSASERRKAIARAFAKGR